MNNITSFAIITLLALPFCRNKQDLLPIKSEPPVNVKQSAALRSNVITEEDQKKLTPDRVIEDLKEGNLNYQQNKITLKDNTTMMLMTMTGQYPEAFILSCMDSRVPVEEVFDRGIGDLFVGRVAGNIIDDDELGSMEYGCKFGGARVIVVLGHESCGAVKAAIAKEELGNITTLLTKITPAIQASQQFAGEHSASNPDYVATVMQNNIFNSIKDIRLQSPILKAMEYKGEIKIVGAYYSLQTGAVTFLGAQP